MDIEVPLPDLGEDAEHEVVLSEWLVEPGQRIGENEELVEVLTDKAVFTVSAPISGVVAQRRYAEGARLRPGEVLAVIRADS